MEEYVREWYGHRTRVLKMEEYVREWFGHRTRVLKMEEYVREWYGHRTRVCKWKNMCVSGTATAPEFENGRICA